MPDIRTVDSAPAIRQAKADPFTLADHYEVGSRGFGVFSFVVWGLVLVGGFFFVNRFAGDFANMREYGPDESGINAVFSLSKNEQLFMATVLLMLPAAVFLTLGLSASLGTRLVTRLRAWSRDDTSARRVFIGIVAGAGVAIALIGALVLRDTPITDDENVYEFQARIFASGHLALPSLPGDDRMFDDNIFLVNNGRIYGQYPFGHSFFLLPGTLVGYSRAMTLIAALLTLLGIFKLGRELYDTRTALLAVFLTAVSPMFLAMSATILSHPSTLLFLTWFAYFTVRAIRADRTRDAVLAAVFFGLAFHVRSATVLVLALPTALVLAGAHVVRIRRRDEVGGEVRGRVQWVLGQTWRRVAVVGAVMGAMLGLYLVLNWLANGSPFLTNYHAVWLGKLPYDSPFGFDKGAWNIVHTPTLGFENLLNNFLRLNIWLLGWPVGFLPVIALFALRRFRWIDLWLLGPVVLNFIVFFFYFWPGVSDTGPVLYYELLLPLSLLGARGVLAASDWLAERHGGDAGRSHVAAFVAACTLLALVSTTQTFLRALMRVSEHVNEPYELLADRGIEEGVVFTDYYLKGDFQDSWVAGRKDTHPLLGDRLHFVLNYGPERNRDFLARNFPGQKGHVLWWTPEGDPRIVALDDYTETYVVRNYPDAR
ncbi:MAG: glycosyltransferase family 39 protein [Deltaproteobacteria bacterium]|nr:glycosyltransferase family 39 protein [Deltaproteobacteria bacterium]